MIMKTTEYKRLIELLKSCKDAAAVKCLERMEQEIPEFTLAGAIPANQVWDIYSRRKAWNESLSNPNHNRISGYDRLMLHLPRGTDQKVKIHGLKWEDTRIAVFTDGETTKYFGLLVVPKMK